MLESMLEMSRQMKAIEDPTQLPNWRAMAMVADEFRKRGLPVKYIGRMEFEVNENFFEDEGEAQEFVTNMCIMIERIYHALEEEFGEDAEKIFADMVSDFSIKYSF